MNLIQALFSPALVGGGGGGGGGVTNWGTIGGTISDQEDLWDQLTVLQLRNVADAAAPAPNTAQIYQSGGVVKFVGGGSMTFNFDGGVSIVGAIQMSQGSIEPNNDSGIWIIDNNGQAMAWDTDQGGLDIGGWKVTNVANPIGATDAANKAYVDAVASGLDPKLSCRAATTANITLSGTQTVDGVSVLVGDRVLVKNQTTQANNGIYAVESGTWTRAADADESAEVTSGLFTFISEGTLQASTGWMLVTHDPIIVGSTALSFTQFSGAGTYTAGSGLTLTGTQFSIGAGQVTNSMLAGSIALTKLSGNTTVGQAVFTLSNPSAITFLRVNADNTVTARSAANFRADLTLDVTGGTYFNSTPADGTVPISSSALYDLTINQLRGLKTSAGTLTLTIQINGVSVTGLTSLSVTSTPQTATATAASVVAGDRVTMVISSMSGAANLEFTLKGTR